MKVKAILTDQLPAISYVSADFEELYYEGGGRVSAIIPVGDPDDKSKIIKITVSFLAEALRIADEGIYLGKDDDAPESSGDRIAMGKDLVLECFESGFLDWFNTVNAELQIDEAKHYCISTMNEIVDFISTSEPTATVEYIDSEAYLSGEFEHQVSPDMTLISNLELEKLRNQESFLIDPEELAAFRKWKQEQDALKEVGF